jgi:hypothetical protein
MSTLKRALATAAVAAVPTTMTAPANAEVLFDNTGTIGENPEYTGVAWYGFSQPPVGSSVNLLNISNPTEPYAGLRITFNGQADANGSVQISLAPVTLGSRLVDIDYDGDGIIDDFGIEPYYTLSGTESATKTINFAAGTEEYSVDFNGYDVNGGDYAILFAALPQGNATQLNLPKAASDSMVGNFEGVFFSTPNFNSFYGATNGSYIPSYNSFAIKIETLPPVPEPDDYAMFLAGLGLVGLAARRRMSLPSASI